MNKANEGDVEKLVKQALSPVDTRLSRELWPQMLQRMESAPTAVPASERGWKVRLVAVPWYDWALGAAAALCVGFVPNLIPVLLYHL